MPNLLHSLRSETSLSIDDWVEMFSFDGNGYSFLGNQTLGGKEERIGSEFVSLVNGAYKTDGIVFACMLARLMVFSEVRFQFRQRSNGRPGKLFGNGDLAILEKPWTNGTTGDLATRAIQDVDIGGNWFAAKRPGKVLRRLRPDCVTIVMGSKTGRELDMEVAGYLYQPKGAVGPEDAEPLVLLPEEVAHWAPIPDPEARFRGMSWLTPILREIMGDKAMVRHQLKFFENGATANMVVKFDPSVKPEAFETWRNLIEEGHKGLSKAYKTLYLGGGADATVVGANMKQVDFTQTRGSGETRIAAAAGTPPVIVGLSEGLKAATYSNYQTATRRFADGTLRPLWRGFAGALAPLIKVPPDAELWYDDRDISFLKEDAKEGAEIQGIKSKTISSLIMAGYEADSCVAAVEANDMSQLVHTGMVSVQMWKPGEGPDSAHTP